MGGVDPSRRQPLPGGNSLGADTIGGAEGGWWARERARFLVERLGHHGVGPGVAVDLGCGRAEVAGAIADELGPFVVACDGEAHPGWRNRPGSLAHVVADVRRPPLRNGCADLVTALDVVEHFADDHQPLLAMHDLARPGDGLLLVTVPAHAALWSPFDEEVGHFRRYDRAGLAAAVTAAGGRVVDTTYFFAWLVPPAWLMRRRTRHTADAVDTGRTAGLTSAAVSVVARLERWVLRRRHLPTGTSLWCLARAAGADQRRRLDRAGAGSAGAGSAG